MHFYFINFVGNFTTKNTQNLQKSRNLGAEKPPAVNAN
jgi:hypothetical protein